MSDPPRTQGTTSIIVAFTGGDGKKHVIAVVIRGDGEGLLRLLEEARASDSVDVVERTVHIDLRDARRHERRSTFPRAHQRPWR